eukprot:scaffold7239_cov58-Isochrysis_galbana.AAC.1
MLCLACAAVVPLQLHRGLSWRVPSPLCLAGGSTHPRRDAFVLLRRAAGDSERLELEESAEVVGPRAARRQSANEARIGRELARARQHHRKLAARVAELDTPALHGSRDLLARLKKEKLGAADRVAALVGALQAVRGAGHAAAAGHALGGGAFGTVLLGRGLLSGRSVAVKVSDARAGGGGGVTESKGGEAGAGGFAGAGSVAATPGGSGVVSPPSELSTEARVLRLLKDADAPGFPRPLYFGRQALGGKPVELLVEEQLGPSLEALWWAAAGGTVLSVGCALRIAEAALLRLQSLHRLGYVHNDISPANFCVGLMSSGEGEAAVPVQR